MKVGDKVQVVYRPTISLLKKHAGIKGKVIKKGFGNKWLVELGCKKLWAKEYELEVIVDE